MKVRFIPASDTRENWLAKNPVALPGEICVEIDTGRWKFGDGSRPYSELPYAKQDFTQEFFEMQKLAAEMQGVVDAEAEREALYQKLSELAEDGKGLSTHDYTDTDKAKVDAIPANPKFTDTVYTHPSTHPASMITQDSARRMVSDAQIASWNDAVGGGLTEAEVIDLIGEHGTVGDFAAADHTHEEYAPKTHSHSEYLTELPTHTHEGYLTAADLPAPVDLSEYPTRFEVQTAVQSVADPVIVLTEAEFAAIVPDATKIYVIY